MKKIAGIITAITLLFSSVAFSSTQTVIFGGVGTGNYFTGTKNSQVVISDSETDTLLQLHQSHPPDYLLGFQYSYPITLGRIRDLFSDITLGPVVYYQPSIFSGQVYQHGTPILNNYTYRSTIDPFNVYFESDFNFHSFWKHHIAPFIILGIGDSIDLITYNDFAVPGIPTSSEVHLKNTTDQNFAFEVGAGLQMNITPTWFIVGRYVYQDIVNAETRTAGNIGVQSPININLNSHSGYIVLGHSFS